jgi:hypothetical protein
MIATVRDMRVHGREPLLGVEDLLAFTVFRRIDNGSFISEILHPFLGKGCPDPETGRFSLLCNNAKCLGSNATTE